MHWIELLLWALLAYLAIGSVVGGVIVWRGLAQIDRAAEHAGWAVRLALWPGMAALWPLVATKWVRAIQRGGPPAPGVVTGMRRLRFAHALAWTAAAPLVGAGLIWALSQRAEARRALEGAPAAESSR